MKKILLMLMFLFVTSCVTEKIVTVPIETVRTEYINNEIHDSIYVRDSIYVESRHDTVFLYKYKYIYKSIEKTDTVIRQDTILVPVPVETIKVEKVNELKLWQKALMVIGLGWLVVFIVKNFKEIKKWMAAFLKFFGI